MQRRVVRLGTTISTQDDAKRAASEGAEEGTTFVADAQERGRGRQGRAWVAPAGSALLASVVLRPRVEPSNLPQLALVVGLAVSDAIATRVGEARVGIKWPNDVHVDDRKIAGVLVEAQLRGASIEAVVAGFGVNLRRAALPADVAARAISLEDAGCGAEALDRDALLDDVLGSLATRLPRFVERGVGAIVDDLRRRDVARGRLVRGDAIEGVASGIDDHGRLLVATSSGLVAVHAGEVVFR